jgi:hypothetical protein
MMNFTAETQREFAEFRRGVIVFLRVLSETSAPLR